MNGANLNATRPAVTFAMATLAALMMTCSDGAELERVVETRGEWRTMGTLKNGKKHGEWLSLRPDGRVWRMEVWKDGAAHGIDRTWHDNGALASEWPYMHDVRHGRYRMFDDDGQIAEIGWFHRGRLEGTTCEWDIDGTVERIAEYRYDYLVREELDPRRPCPITQGVGRRHLDRENTEYGQRPLGKRQRRIAW